MSSNTNTITEQRAAERISIGEIVDFRCNQDEAFRSATMVDFSEAGMLLLLDEKHTTGSEFEVRIIEEGKAIYFSVTCVRYEPCTDVELYGHGCKIEKYRVEG